MRSAPSDRPYMRLAAFLCCVCLLGFWIASRRSTPSGRIDMHTHSAESDGDRTAEEQIELAAAQGLRGLWLTDHDMIREPPRTRALLAAARTAGVHLGLGVEITVSLCGHEHHLLGYFPDSTWVAATLSPAMLAVQQACAEVKRSREHRNDMLVAHVNHELQNVLFFESATAHKQYKPIAVHGVATWAAEHAGLAEPASLGRPHFRKFLLALGVREAMIFGPRDGDGRGVLQSDGTAVFDAAAKGIAFEALLHSKTLERREIAFRPLDAAEAVQLIAQAGGRAVVAHPPTLGPKWLAYLRACVPGLAAAGLWGVEAFSAEIDAAGHLALAELASTHGLRLSGGSDSHGRLKVYARLGTLRRIDSPEYPALAQWDHAAAAAADQTLRTDQL